MVFSLEALRAQHGDCLLLHYGTVDDPRTMLIDGGPGQVYGETLKPRLLELRKHLIALGRIKASEALPLALAMVSHIDDDHIGGLLALAEDPNGGLGLSCASWVAPRTLWHNTLTDLAGDSGPVGDLALGYETTSKTAAVIASVPQGGRLRACAKNLGWQLNRPFNNGPGQDVLVQAPAQGGRRVKLDDATDILVVSPRTDEIEGLRREWNMQLERLHKGETISAKTAEYLDRSPYNLSSIVCLVRQGERKILLTGDARGDIILDALDAARVTSEGKLHVDVLKIPHHGSIRDVDPDFFARITADHYVISGNGRDGNPETGTLELIARSREDDDFAIHLTYASGKGDLQERLVAFIDARDTDGRTFTVEVRRDTDLSLTVDLGDPPFATQANP
jgi:hypothetical protein